MDEIAKQYSNERTEVPAIRVTRFWTDYKPDPKKPGEMVGVDWVEWRIRGDQHTSMRSEAVSRLCGGEKWSGHEQAMKYYAPSPEWVVIEPAYEAWKKKQDIPVNGTPLDAWPGLNPAQAEALKAADILTVEDCANMTDGQIGRARLPDARQIKERAKAFIAAKGDQSRIAAELASRDDLIAQQAAAIEELRARMEALAGEAEPVKRRGRPPRAQTEEVEAA